MAKKPNLLGQFSDPVKIPPLIGGWNARDPLASMPPEDAVILQNFVPGTGGISLRTGFSAWASAIGGPVSSLMEYNGPSSEFLFAASGANIYNVTSSGPVGAPVVTGMTSDFWQSTMFETPAPLNWLIICNGSDPVQEFDGTSWSVPTITGISSSALINVAPMASRLFFIEENSLHIWYLGIGAIQGAATLFDLGTQFMLGGKLVALATLSQSGGSGPSDNYCFFSDRGEVVIYQGTDPSSITTWFKVGTYRIPEPIGTRCVVKSGADLGVITQLGVLPLSAVLPISNAGQGRAAVTDKIKGAFQAAHRATGDMEGWQIIEYPQGALVIVNVPQADGVTFQQYVMNMQTGAWCNFVGINGLSWSLLEQNLFFGDTSGNVWQFDTGTTDNGNAIAGVVLPAFEEFGTSGFKRFLMARPLYNGPVGSNPPVVLRTEYDTTLPTSGQTIIPAGQSPWNSPWYSPWGAAIGPISQWQGLEGIGQVGSLMLSVASYAGLTLNYIDVLVEPGGMF